MNNYNQKSNPLPVENAGVSVRMEGYEVTPEMREQCERILRGEATLPDYLKRFLRPPGGLSIMAYSIDPIQDGWTDVDGGLLMIATIQATQAPNNQPLSKKVNGPH